MITLRSFGDEGGTSRKPGNIFLNWRKLMDIVPDAAIATAGYNKAINRLLAMECIEIDNGIISLREWVRVSY